MKTLERVLIYRRKLPYEHRQERNILYFFPGVRGTQWVLFQVTNIFQHTNQIPIHHWVMRVGSVQLQIRNIKLLFCQTQIIISIGYFVLYFWGANLCLLRRSVDYPAGRVLDSAASTTVLGSLVESPAVFYTRS